MKRGTMDEILKEENIDYFESWNEAYKKGAFAGSEATAYNLVNIRKWIGIRDSFTFIDDIVPGKWKYIDLKEEHSKYGTNYIFVEPDQKLWRIKPTGSEFYGHPGEPYEF